jgi:hypothetical protein
VYYLFRTKTNTNKTNKRFPKSGENENNAFQPKEITGLGDQSKIYPTEPSSVRLNEWSRWKITRHKGAGNKLSISRSFWFLSVHIQPIDCGLCSHMRALGDSIRIGASISLLDSVMGCLWLGVLLWHGQRTQRF